MCLRNLEKCFENKNRERMWFGKISRSSIRLVTEFRQTPRKIQKKHAQKVQPRLRIPRNRSKQIKSVPNVLSRKKNGLPYPRRQNLTHTLTQPTNRAQESERMRSYLIKVHLNSFLTPTPFNRGRHHHRPRHRTISAAGNFWKETLAY